MEAECSLLHSQKPAACFCRETVQSTPRPSKTISRMSVLISFNLPLGLRSVLPPSPRILRKKGCIHLSFTPYLPHAVSVSLYVVLFFRRIVFTPSSNPQAGGPPLVGCPRLLIEYIRSSLHLVGRSSIRNLRTHHAVLTGPHLTFVCLRLSLLLPI